MPAAARLLCAALAALCLAAPLPARQRSPVPPTPAPAVTVTADEVNGHRSALQERTDPTESTQQAIKRCDEALASLELARQWEEQLARFERELAGAPGEMEQVQQRLAEPAAGDPEVPADASLEQLKQLRDQAEAAQKTAREKKRELEAEKVRRDQRRSEIPLQREAARVGLEEVRTDLAAAPIPDEPAELATARRMALEAKHRALAAQVAALDKELANYDARRELLPLRQELWSRRTAAADKQAEQWREIVSRREQQIADQEQAAARQELERLAAAAPAIKAVAEKGLELAELKSQILEKKTQVERLYQQDFLVRLRLVRERHQRSLDRAGAALTNVIDLRLRRERGELPDLRALQRDLARRRTELLTVQVALADLEFEFDELPPVPEQKQEILQSVAADVPPALRERLEANVEARLTEQRLRYRALIDVYKDYLDTLEKAQEAERRLIASTEDYLAFIDERILWIRSAGAIRGSDFNRAWTTITEHAAPEKWLGVARDLWGDLRANPGAAGVPALALVLLLVARRRIPARLRSLARQVRRGSSDRMSLTWGALGLTVTLAAYWPVVLWFIAWRLRAFDGSADFSKVVAAGLSRTAVLLAAAELLRHACRADGLGDAHFRWRKEARSELRRNLHWFMPAVLPLAFVIAALEWESADAGSDPLGRFAFILGMVLLAVFAARVLRPTGGMLRGAMTRRRGGWLDRLSPLWYTAIIAIPIAQAVAAGGGFYYTALQLERRTLSTVFLIEALVILNGMLVRSIVVARRRLALEEARKRQAADARTGPAGDGDGATSAAELERLDLAAVDTQARQMLRTVTGLTLLLGAWLIWAQVLPALSILDRVEVWPKPGIVAAAPAERPAVIDDMATAPATGAAAAANAQATNGGPPPADGEAATGGGAPPAPPSPEGATPPDRGVPLIGASEAAAVSEVSGSVVTLNDVALAAIVVILMIVISRDLPGVMEMTILRRLPLEPSGRYAITALARYAILIFGIGLAFSAIGIGWSKVQWLAAAVTVGLGFGLQEIFANFVSGIIILFERPIRVGDAVTVGTVNGTVSRIRMRATTITDWDRKELIVPNKEFVTGQVINWSLSDPILRMKIPVGIAYGSDTERARELLLQVAKETPYVLDDPAPSAVFGEFGESSLNFELRVFIPHIDHMFAVRSQLHFAIDRAFREAGIEIAFPQRDLHIKSVTQELPWERVSSEQ